VLRASHSNDLHAYALESNALIEESIEGYQNVEQMSVTHSGDIALEPGCHR
jgi:hypothetical protein